jgi:hypothetical protein
MDPRIRTRIRICKSGSLRYYFTKDSKSFQTKVSTDQNKFEGVDSALINFLIQNWGHNLLLKYGLFNNNNLTIINDIPMYNGWISDYNNYIRTLGNLRAFGMIIDRIPYLHVTWSPWNPVAIKKVDPYTYWHFVDVVWYFKNVNDLLLIWKQFF